MDFFEDQQIARRNTGRLIALFLLAVVCIIVLAYVAAVITLGYVLPHLQNLQTVRQGYSAPAPSPVAPFEWWRPEILIGVVVGTLAVVMLSSAYRISQLRAGGGVVASSMGGVLITADTANDTEKQLLNVVEEMAIASGTAVPPVYVLREEPGINAFAAGFTPNTAVITVTQGTLDTLTRDELQGVIGHEFSHILNGDIRLNIRLIGVIFGIIAITVLGSILLRAIWFADMRPRRSNDRGGGQVMLAIAAFGFLLIVIGYVGSFFAKLIQAAVSRQREFLADAASVQFTRYPQGIAGALKKIGGHSEHSRLQSPHTHQVAHMCFGQAFTMSFGGMFATHPPLKERIKRIDPSFDGTFPEVAVRRQAHGAKREPSPKAARKAGMPNLAERIRVARETAQGATKSSSGVAKMEGLLAPVLTAGMLGGGGGGGGGGEAPAGEAGKAAGGTGEAAVAASRQIGRPTIEHLAYANELIKGMPEAVSRAAHEPYGARAVVYGLLLDESSEVRRVQLERLADNAEPHVYELVKKLLDELAAFDARARLPLLDLTVPALRKLSPRQYEEFKGNVAALINADNKVELFEWVLQRMILRKLDPHFTGARPTPVRYRRLAAVAGPCATLLSALAWIGAEDAAQAKRAFAAARDKLDNVSLKLAAAEECGRERLDQALDTLGMVAPPLKRRLIDAATAAVAADKKVTVREAELLRAICDALDAPMPPMLPRGAGGGG